MAGPTNQLSVEELFNIHRDKLELEWIAGQDGKKRAFACEEEQNNQKDSNNVSLIGYLNPVHPHQIQVISKVEIEYLEGLRDVSMHDAISQLFNSKPVCVIVTDGSDIPALLKQKSDENNIALFSSKKNSSKLAEILHYFLTGISAKMLTIHGVYMEVMAIGVLITGPSGIGKSELALELISRGHRLIADDAPLFSKIAPDIITGTCPITLQDFLEVRGLGIINVRELFGDSAIKKNKYLKLIVNLEPMSTKDLLSMDRLEGSYKTRNVLDMDISQITLPVASGRNLAVMLECAARNHILREGGYNAPEIFARRQLKLMNAGEK